MNVGELLEVTTDYYPARQTIPSLIADLGYPCELFDADQAVFRFVHLVDDGNDAEAEAGRVVVRPLSGAPRADHVQLRFGLGRGGITPMTV